MEKHICQAVVIHCIDFRIQEAIHDFLQGFHGVDHISLAGGVKELLEKGKESLTFSNLEISSRLHEPKKIILVQHEDCGAYGGSKAFENAQKETEFQREQLEKAKELLSVSFFQAIETKIAYLTGEMK